MSRVGKGGVAGNTAGNLQPLLAQGSFRPQVDGDEVVVEIAPSRLENLQNLQAQLLALKEAAVGLYETEAAAIACSRAWENGWSPLVKAVVGFVGITIATVILAKNGMEDLNTSETWGVALGYVFGMTGCMACCFHNDAGHMRRNHDLDQQERQLDTWKVRGVFSVELTEINALSRELDLDPLPHEIHGDRLSSVANKLYHAIDCCEQAIADEKQRLKAPAVTVPVAAGPSA
jgi:type IV secretory pathway VirB2 component (pilin)